MMYDDPGQFVLESEDLFNMLNEAEYVKVTDQLKLEILDVERFVKVNESTKPISNPRAFMKDNIPSSDGLLSNEIFGITMEDRAGIYGYIDLHGTFIDPSCYKALIRIDSKFRNIVHGIGTYKIDEKGDLVEDPNGKTGLDFLQKNIKKINFKSSSSVKRDIKITFIKKNIDKMFITKFIVIPPFYRDKNSGASRTVGLGGVNKLYNNLIVSTNALTATQDFMFDASDSMKGRVQEQMLGIYDWFCGNTNSSINTDPGVGLSGKMGILRRANMSKTANFSSRLVISASELKVEKPENLMVDFKNTAVPLAAAIAEFRDFVMFHTKRFFENEFNGVESYPIVDKDGNLKYMIPKEPEIMFSDERIKKEMDRYLHGYNNRFIPVEIEMEDAEPGKNYYMQFKGRTNTPDEAKQNPEAIFHRRLTWCDIFFIACTEATKDKQLLITRFPIFPNKIKFGLSGSVA